MLIGLLSFMRHTGRKTITLFLNICILAVVEREVYRFLPFTTEEGSS